ncbi:heme o synthase [Alicyclobacillus herbarius]|uniref:heme o synthase n=1 Tax=Alicyclobacillus herbarius TaxID=122960 RepID=UPI001B7FA422|nr:heme o synthase [Alicyclobacillus herbarius]
MNAREVSTMTARAIARTAGEAKSGTLTEAGELPGALKHLAQRWTRCLAVYLELTKPRILALLVFTQWCAMVWAAKGWPSPSTTFAATVGLALCAGGSAAVNMWYDRDIDARMQRTVHRPLPQGRIPALHALVLGVGLGVAGVAVLAWSVNPLSALLAAAGYVYYACVYTMGLKRHTPQNIVFGGGAGAFPPLVGWAAVTGHLAWPAWVLFAIIFLWTPSHFWALALYRNADYKAAGVPMMPTVRGTKSTIFQMGLYSLLLLPVSLLPYWALVHPWPYETVAGLTGAVFLAAHAMLWRTRQDVGVWARRTFFLSLIYLPVVFFALAASAWT